MIELKKINKEGMEKLVSWNKGESEDFLCQWCGKKSYSFPITTEQVEIRSRLNDVDLFSIYYKSQIIGSIEFSKSNLDDGYIRFGKFIIASEYRGQGLGAKVLEFIFKFVPREYGVNNLQLGVFRFNKRAYSLYKNLGFKESQTVESEIDSCWDSITMNKVLI